MLNQDLIQEEFGYLEDVVFLNISSVVMPPQRVRNAYRSFMDDYVSNFGDGVVPKAWGLVENARPALAKLIHAAQPHEIAFVKNTSEGISAIANGFPFAPGDNVVLADQEHGSLLYPWINVHEQKGVDLHVVKSVDGEIPFADMVAAMDTHTRILAVSAVQFSTGFAADLMALGAECHRRGIVFVVDGIQALGRLNIDVQACHIDYLAGGSNKGMLGTLGTGFIYCSDRIVQSITPSCPGNHSVVSHVTPPAITTNFDTLEWQPHAKRFEGGNQSYNCIQALHKGVELILELGIDHIDAHIRMLEAYLRKQLTDLTLPVVQAKDPKNWGGIVCVYYPKEHEDQVTAILQRHHIYATIRGGYIRLGLGLYNTTAHMDIVSQALHEIAAL